ncbi:TPA: histidinol dehydrogenase [Candidatus Poribacteria bacterium]|nr:histidinol dehydrogenase [Candidatus Poribacteria bacterium]
MTPILIDGSPEATQRLELLLSRGRFHDDEILSVVREIIGDVSESGDDAVVEYTRRFDAPAFDLDQIRVGEEEYEMAYMVEDEEFVKSIRLAIDRVRSFHERQMRNSWFASEEDGVILGQIVQPIRRVGIHVPAFSQFLVSTLIMCVIPAKVAGVEEIVVCTPPMRNGRINPYMLITAKECGVDELYKVGGAQAVAAMAFGTKRIKRVDKIVGPGNIYVQMAKRELFGIVDIDMIAGPSEILVIADDSADPSFVAADLLSQAEHMDDSSAVLITDNIRLAQKVRRELERRLQDLSRSQIALHSLKKYGAIFVTESLDRAFDLAAQIAPEHLEIMVREPFRWLGKVRNAGAVLLGPYSPEAVGDYIAGPNHTLPTGGTAKFYSPLGVDDFLKKTSLIQFTESALKKLAPAVIKLAEVEGLDGHAKSVRLRLERPISRSI